MVTINPFLSFKGNCEEAFNLYKSIFSTDFSHIVRYKGIPSENPIPDSKKEKIMHIALPISKEIILMGCDVFETLGRTPKTESNLSLSVNTQSEEETTRIFDALATDGIISFPLSKTFRCSKSDMWIDNFGIQWMISLANKQNSQVKK